MEQLAFVLPPPRARREDRETSHAAARKAHAFQSGHHAKILEALGVARGTYKEIADRCGLERHAVARRLKELATCSPPLIRRTGEERDSCDVWELVP